MARDKKLSKNIDIRKDVKKLVAEIARVNPNKIDEDTDIREDLGIDSLASVEILAAIEKRLGIAIDEAEAFDIETVKDLLDLVTEYMEKK